MPGSCWVRGDAMNAGDPLHRSGRRRDPGPQALAPHAAELAQAFVSLAGDVALLMDTRGFVSTVACADPPVVATQGWLGRPLDECVEPDSREKVRALLAEVSSCGRSGRHEINHLGRSPAAPVAWRALRLGRGGPVLAVGQDLGPQRELQQRFLLVQEALERTYAQAQQQLARDDGARPLMTPRERHSLGLAPSPHLDDPGGDAADALKLALDRLHERIGRDSLQDLLRDARRVAEQQFLRRALLRAGSLEALARSLGVSRRTLLRRGGAALRTMIT